MNEWPTGFSAVFCLFAGTTLLPPPPAISDVSARTIRPENRRRLREALGADRLRENVSLAPFTTFQIGGPADLYYEARTADELCRAVRLCRECDIPHFLLGRGANILIGDLGVRGLVIRNAAAHCRVERERERLWVESGAIVYPDVIDTAIEAGLSGLEHYVGIPSTVGGALWQNLHFLSPPPERERTMFIEEVLHSADLLTEENERKTVGRDYFRFGYDYSILHDREDVVLAATFQLTEGAPERMRAIAEANLQWRGERHPPLDDEPSAGSIFKKIEGVGAGRLIDECGLKGLRIGGAEITHRHANIMINRANARASDVRALIQHVQHAVEEETGYRLEPEISFIGDFAPPSEAEPTFAEREAGLVSAEERAAR
jgi:UDP-N-acetylmuramate dehydrogenase